MRGGLVWLDWQQCRADNSSLAWLRSEERGDEYYLKLFLLLTAYRIVNILVRSFVLLHIRTPCYYQDDVRDEGELLWVIWLNGWRERWIDGGWLVDTTRLLLACIVIGSSQFYVYDFTWSARCTNYKIQWIWWNNKNLKLVEKNNRRKYISPYAPLV